MDAPSPPGDGRLSLALALARAEAWLAKAPAGDGEARAGAKGKRRGGRALPGFMTWRYLLLSAGSVALLLHALERMK
jgi:hypothetical protein